MSGTELDRADLSGARFRSARLNGALRVRRASSAPPARRSARPRDYA
ncbi:pentapeptide repeat-containing protein [Cellulomonas sp. P5_E12]